MGHTLIWSSSSTPITSSYPLPQMSSSLPSNSFSPLTQRSSKSPYKLKLILRKELGNNSLNLTNNQHVNLLNSTNSLNPFLNNNPQVYNKLGLTHNKLSLTHNKASSITNSSNSQDSFQEPT